MNWDQVKDNWKQLKGKAQQAWGDPTDDELDVIEGKREEFVGRLQAKYPYYTKPDLSLPAKVYRANRYLYPHESDQEAMRGDWEKIGADFRVSIAKAERETAGE